MKNCSEHARAQDRTRPGPKTQQSINGWSWGGNDTTTCNPSSCLEVNLFPLWNLPPFGIGHPGRSLFLVWTATSRDFTLNASMGPNEFTCLAVILGLIDTIIVKIAKLGVIGLTTRAGHWCKRRAMVVFRPQPPYQWLWLMIITNSYYMLHQSLFSYIRNVVMWRPHSGLQPFYSENSIVNSK